MSNIFLYAGYLQPPSMILLPNPFLLYKICGISIKHQAGLPFCHCCKHSCSCPSQHQLLHIGKRRRESDHSVWGSGADVGEQATNLCAPIIHYTMDSFVKTKKRIHNQSESVTKRWRASGRLVVINKMARIVLKGAHRLVPAACLIL